MTMHTISFAINYWSKVSLFMQSVLDHSNRAPIANLGLWDDRGKIWDYGITPCLKLGLQKSALKLGLFISNSTKFGFSIHSKLGLWDFTLFEIGITGLRLFSNWDYGITGHPLWGP